LGSIEKFQLKNIAPVDLYRIGEPFFYVVASCSIQELAVLIVVSSAMIVLSAALFWLPSPPELPKHWLLSGTPRSPTDSLD
jgi:hypothetical protein